MPVTTKVGAARVGGPKPCRSFSYQNLPEPSRVQAGVRYREFKLVSVVIIARVRAFWWLLRMDSGVTGVKACPPQGCFRHGGFPACVARATTCWDYVARVGTLQDEVT